MGSYMDGLLKRTREGREAAENKKAVEKKKAVENKENEKRKHEEAEEERAERKRKSVVGNVRCQVLEERVSLLEKGLQAAKQQSEAGEAEREELIRAAGKDRVTYEDRITEILQLTNDKAALEQSLHNSEQRLAKVELHKDSLTREVEDLSQIKEDLTVELARTQKEKEIQGTGLSKDVEQLKMRLMQTTNDKNNQIERITRQMQDSLRQAELLQSVSSAELLRANQRLSELQLELADAQLQVRSSSSPNPQSQHHAGYDDDIVVNVYNEVEASEETDSAETPSMDIELPQESDIITQSIVQAGLFQEVGTASASTASASTASASTARAEKPVFCKYCKKNLDHMTSKRMKGHIDNCRRTHAVKVPCNRCSSRRMYLPCNLAGHQRTTKCAGARSRELELED